MKIFNKKTLGLAAIALALPMTVMAASTTIEATASFREAITLGGEVDMAFGQVDYSGTPGAGDTVTMDLSGNLTSAGNFTGAATGTAGSVDIQTGTDGLTIEVQCDTTATLTDAAGSESIQVNNISVGTIDNLGSPSACAGTGSAAMTFALSAGTNDTLKLGGVLDGNTASAGFGGGAYSTANTSGDNIEVVVIYQ